jgi:hypothetical protein
MIDPREVEGTPERAADRGREQDLGIVVTDKPSLGSAPVVQGLVSEFAGAVVNVRKRYNQDKLSGEQAQAEVRALAKEYGDIVMGRDQRYQALPWNDPARLGRRIKLVTAPIDGVTDPGEQLFLTVGLSIIELATAHEDERISDESTQAQMQEMLQDTANLVQGVR